jgi:hypothetical protein
MSPFIVPVAMFAMVAVIVVGLPIARALARRMDRQSLAPPIPNEVAQRLERMEQAIDAIAVEVERISEGQRFTTNLLADRGAAGAGAHALPGAGTPNAPRRP